MKRLAVLLALLPACSTKAATSPADGAAAEVAKPSPSGASSAGPSASAAPPPTAAAVASAAPEAAPPATASALSSAAPSVAPAEAALPAVKVANIGMHIGGGPNDDVTKDPIRRSVQPHFDELRRCFTRVDEAKTGDFGVDLRIDKAGGKAQVSHPRTALKGKEFKECVVHVFEGIDFLKPKGGTTTVSYSLRFTPHKE